MTHSGTGSSSAKPISVLRPAAKVEELVGSSFVEDLVVAAGHGMLNEDLALLLLQRRDLSPQVLEALVRNHAVMKHRKVLVQVVEHPRTPRHIALPMLRRLFVFELMRVGLEPAVPADLKLLVEDLLIDKLETLSLGECINLARRASPGVAGALLLHEQRAVIEAALQNPRMTEASIAKSLAKPEVPAVLLSMLIEHPKWSLRRELQIAILRRAEATEAVVLQTAAKLPKPAILDVLSQVRLPEGREELLRRLLETR
jgi:hypothetical protein